MEKLEASRFVGAVACFFCAFFTIAGADNYPEGYSFLVLIPFSMWIIYGIKFSFNWWGRKK